MADDSAGPDRPPVDAGSGDSGDRVEFVRKWANAVIGTSYLPKGRPAVRAFLDECTGELIASLVAEEFSTGPAERVGAKLIEAHVVDAVALRRTLTLIGTELPKLVPIASGELLLARLVGVLGALGAGFTQGVRDRVLAEQGVIQQAVLDARDAAEEALRASEERFRAVFTSSALGIAIVALDGTVGDVNESMVTIFRSSRECLLGCSIFDLADPEWLPDLREAQEQLLSTTAEVDTCLSGRDGSQVWTQVSASLVRDARGDPDYQVVLYADITRRRMLQDQLHHQAMHDPLTGLANRTKLDSRLQESLVRQSRGRRVGLCYLDLDGFKTINDSLGHPIGDDLLRAIARRVLAVADSEGALAARMGGDEFVVLIPDSRGADRVCELVERLLYEITRPVRIGGHDLEASASAGIVEREVATTNAQELLRDADITLYRAKDEGRAQWLMFDAQRNAAARERFRLSATMPAGLDNHEFVVEYHPVTRLDGGGLVAVQAEVVWDHPELGELDAADFVDMAEETGVITRLDEWVLRQACDHAVRWRDALGSVAPVVGVDLSARHFGDPELIGDVKRLLSETGLPPEYLRLGVPEAALFDHHGDPVDTVEILTGMGVGLVVRDFGVDYTRLARLRDLPLTSVKIAGGYLDRLDAPAGPDPLDEHLVQGVVSAALMLGMTVVATAVDTAEQAERLRGMGVHAAQGEYAGVGASAMEITQMISTDGGGVP